VLTRSALKAVWPFVGFAGWSLFTCLWNPPTKEGFQNLAVIVAYVGLVLLAARSGASPQFPRSLENSLASATWIAVALFAPSFVASTWGLGVFLVGYRTFALFALFGVAYYIARWRYGLHRGIWYALVVSAAIAISLSRVATALVLFLFGFSQFSPRSVVSWGRMVLLGGLMLGIAYLAVTNIAPLRARFFGGDEALHVGVLTLNTMGRAAFWPTVFHSFLESPWIGKGAGSAQMLILAHYARWVEHPHNDYLRLLHDYGLVGLGLWLLAISSSARAMFRGWMRSDLRRPVEARLHMTAFLSLLAISVAMITDNAIVYAFLMAPLAVVVGTSLGRASSSQP
jgi:O-antigen ligase